VPLQIECSLGLTRATWAWCREMWKSTITSVTLRRLCALRPTKHLDFHENYVCIGESYSHGLMDGEAFEAFGQDGALSSETSKLWGEQENGSKVLH